VTEESQLKLMRALEANPNASQRELARLLGVSLGKTNYCLRALIDRGLVKARNFTSSRNKAAYAYLLTPRGFEEKARVTRRFLALKQAEYEALRREIAELRREAGQGGAGGERDNAESPEVPSRSSER